MRLFYIIRAISKVMLQVAALLAIALIVIQTTPRLEESPVGGLTEIWDARSFDVV
jgi:hypothetical protein